MAAAALLSWGDLRHYAWLQVPMWVFDVDRMRVPWANEAGVAFWRASDLQRLQARDFADASTATRARLQASMQQHAAGRVLRETWTLYPLGQPLSTALLSRGLHLADGRQAILFCSEPLAASYDADMLRGIEALQHTPVRVLLHQLDSTDAVMRNPAAIEAFGPLDDRPGASPLAALFADAADAEALLAAVRAGHTHAGDALLLTSQGPCWHALDARSARDPVSGDVLLLVNARDISDLKAAHTALELARDAAEAANRAKTTFLANMSHEIRTPMNGVLGLTEILLASRLDERQRHHLQLVQQSAQTLMQIINDLLDISRIEADKMTLRPAPLRLRDALHDSLAPLQLQAGQRGLALDWQVAPEVPDTVLADGLRWCQVLLNLAGNALKFTHAGRIDVHLACAGEDSAGLQLACRVTDTGIGMTDAELSQVFEPFVQADDSITRRYGGTGLGLSIARHLVRLMGGELEAGSQPGQGSCFRFTVPVQRVAAPPAPQQAH
ncbi:hybrid sensor histidine kinase/response regulator [Pseudaquabacterium pictum]|uniref:Sensory/regulatory protein RpfC n=1 Tax=Pseudaquabacterium pictum TaxID=2315236 RepID=A0A480AKZ3_9BURK|nr:ATP-binding protein [Rubrivivax pictus]GCL62231.1 hypothetical protein AQPW35_13120 [Rubrivivax pictus]